MGRLQLLPDSACELIVVDSGSTDRHLTERLVNRIGATFIGSPENIGYGCGSNLGAKYATGSWLVFVNPDVHLTIDDAEQLVAQAKGHQIACLGPTVLDLNGAKKISWGRTITPPWRPRRRNFNLAGNLIYAETVSGCCMAISSDTFHALGGFDEEFFMFCEEMDLHRRLGQQGGKIATTTSVVVQTPGGASSQGVTDRWRSVERMVGHTNYMYKHFTKLEGLIAVLYNITRIVVFYPAKSKRLSIKQFLRGIGRHL